jgi:hypothetical protein
MLGKLSENFSKLGMGFSSKNDSTENTEVKMIDMD